MIKCLISTGMASAGDAMMLLSLGGTPAEQATPACDLYFLLSAPTSQIAKITHFFQKRDYWPMFGRNGCSSPGGPSSSARFHPPPYLLPQSSRCGNAIGTNKLLDVSVIASANKGWKDCPPLISLCIRPRVWRRRRRRRLFLILPLESCYFFWNDKEDEFGHLTCNAMTSRIWFWFAFSFS